MISLESIFIIGVTKLEELVIKTSSAEYNCFFVKLFSFIESLFFLINFLITSLVMPLRISVFEGWVINILFFTIQTLELVASVTFPLSINIASYAFFFAASFLAKTFGSNETVFISLLFHLKSLNVIAFCP